MQRLAYLCLAWTCIGLGAAGLVLPVLPTTPFLLVAAWAAPKASPRLDAWLLRHRFFGPPIHAWREEGAVPARAKRIACALMLASWIVMALTTGSWWVPVVTGALFLCVGIYVCTRPLPRGERPRP
ncbi:MAG: YbaN family protein [Burkholderiales bacterium]